MTETLRPKEAGVIRFGMEPDPGQQIPPHYEKFMSQGHCSSACTAKVMMTKLLTLRNVLFLIHCENVVSICFIPGFYGSLRLLM